MDSRNGGMRNLSMKKFGTPMRAGPGVASAKVGFVRADAPVEVVSFGAGTLTSALCSFARSLIFGPCVLHSRPEVEVEHFLVSTDFSSTLTFLRATFFLE